MPIRFIRSSPALARMVVSTFCALEVQAHFGLSTLNVLTQRLQCLRGAGAGVGKLLHGVRHV